MSQLQVRKEGSVRFLASLWASSLGPTVPFRGQKRSLDDGISPIAVVSTLGAEIKQGPQWVRRRRSTRILARSRQDMLVCAGSITGSSAVQ